ncbi:MAG: hypothetical protein KBT34_05255 [Prevotella sp.]|nr:hypothetical protein [Candidatus Prevotella equi]
MTEDKDIKTNDIPMVVEVAEGTDTPATDITVEKNDVETTEEGKKKSLLSSSSVLGNKTIEDVIKREAKEEQDTSSPFSLSKTLGGVIIARAIQRQIGLVLLICVFLIIYINNRYICQEKLVEIATIQKKLNDARYKSIDCSSRLTENSRESNIMQLLNNYGDSTLTTPNHPPYLIRVEE